MPAIRSHEPLLQPQGGVCQVQWQPPHQGMQGRGQVKCANCQKVHVASYRQCETRVAFLEKRSSAPIGQRTSAGPVTQRRQWSAARPVATNYSFSQALGNQQESDQIGSNIGTRQTGTNTAMFPMPAIRSHEPLLQPQGGVCQVQWQPPHQGMQGRGQVKCANCQKVHVASYRQCETRVAFLEKRSSAPIGQRTSAGPVTQRRQWSAARPVATNYSFSQALGNQQESDQIGSNIGTRQTGTNTAMFPMPAIRSHEPLLQPQGGVCQVQWQPPHQGMQGRGQVKCANCQKVHVASYRQCETRVAFLEKRSSAPIGQRTSAGPVTQRRQWSAARPVATNYSFSQALGNQQESDQIGSNIGTRQTGTNTAMFPMPAIRSHEPLLQPQGGVCQVQWQPPHQGMQGRGQVKCANCQKVHVASYRQCETRVAFLEKRSSAPIGQRTSAGPVTQRRQWSAARPVATNYSFSQALGNQQESDQIGSNIGTRQTGTNTAMFPMPAIRSHEPLLQPQGGVCQVQWQPPHQGMQGRGQVKCANCQKVHVASYRQCETRVAFLEKRSSAPIGQRTSAGPVTQRRQWSAARPVATNYSFSQALGNQQESDQIGSNIGTRQTGTNTAMFPMPAIRSHEPLLQPQGGVCQVQWQPPHQGMQGRGQVKCANCQKVHVASYRQCETRVAFLEKRSSAPIGQRTSAGPVTQRRQWSAARPVATNYSFSQALGNQQESDQIGSNIGTRQTGTNTAMFPMPAIRSHEPLLQPQGGVCQVQWQPPHQGMQGRGQVKCANCQKVHVASYRQCETRVAFLEKRSSAPIGQRTSAGPVTQRRQWSAARPVATNYSFSQALGNQQESDQIGSNIGTRQTGTNTAMFPMPAIRSHEPLLQPQGGVCQVQWQPPHQGMQGRGQVKCANCQKVHVASYRQCETRVAFLEKRSSAPIGQRTSAGPVTQRRQWSAARPVATNYSFSQALGNQQESDQIGSNIGTRQTGTNTASLQYPGSEGRLSPDQDAPWGCGEDGFLVRAGEYEYLWMPFGMKTAPTTFQRLMDEFLEGLDPNTIQIYMDDIVVFSRSVEDHGRHLAQLLHRLQEFGLRASEEKSSFFQSELKFMGHTMSERGVSTNCEKIRAVSALPLPKDPKEVKSFQGMVGYYRRFMPNLADKLAPWTRLVRKSSSSNHTCGAGDSKITRWKETLAAYDFDIDHTRGAENVVADCQSRLINATSTDDPQDASEAPEPFALRHLREWAESGPDLEVGKPAGLRHLREWAESGPDLPPTEPGPSGVQEQRPTEDGVRRLTWGREMLNSKRRQVVLETGTGDGVVTTEMATFMLDDTTYYVYVESAPEREQLERLYAAGRLGNTRWEWTLNRVRTVTDTTEQVDIVRTYHVGKTNHRGNNHWTSWNPMFWAGLRVLTMMDRLTQFAFAHQLRNKTACTGLLSFFGTVGLPGTLVVNRGREFHNARVKSLLEELGIRAHITTPGHPRSHGTVERLHSTMAEHLRLLKLERGLEGSEAVARAVLAYNQSVHVATDAIPLELMQTWQMLTGSPPPDVVLGRAGEVTRESKEKRVHRINNAKAPNRWDRIRVGDDTWVKNWYRRRKEDPKFVGPFRVLKKLVKFRIKIRDVATGRTQYVHVNETRVPSSANRRASRSDSDTY
ncbi:hypothetical protein AAG570_012926 [Ranatra chinensis]|uniref:Integrase catalytic domain-containing protein n=1 Tax=Ranatra chinensis TaxID=642074 RepID=A0ABD0Z1H9_9HEMI